MEAQGIGKGGDMGRGLEEASQDMKRGSSTWI